MKEKNSIILTGMPGSGKTSTGLELSKKTGLEFFDLDFFIEKKTNQKISEIFEKMGEAYFRELETASIIELKDKTPFILSTGGGTILNPENIKLLKEYGKIFYLNAEITNIYDRIKFDKSRPLLKKDDPKKALFELYKQRKTVYDKAFDFEIDANKDINSVSDEIIKIYEKIES